MEEYRRLKEGSATLTKCDCVVKRSRKNSSLTVKLLIVLLLGIVICEFGAIAFNYYQLLHAQLSIIHLKAQIRNIHNTLDKANVSTHFLIVVCVVIMILCLIFDLQWFIHNSVSTQLIQTTTVMGFGTNSDCHFPVFSLFWSIMRTWFKCTR